MQVKKTLLTISHLWASVIWIQPHEGAIQIIERRHWLKNYFPLRTRSWASKERQSCDFRSGGSGFRWAAGSHTSSWGSWLTRCPRLTFSRWSGIFVKHPLRINMRNLHPKTSLWAGSSAPETCKWSKSIGGQDINRDRKLPNDTCLEAICTAWHRQTRTPAVLSREHDWTALVMSMHSGLFSLRPDFQVENPGTNEWLPVSSRFTTPLLTQIDNRRSITAHLWFLQACYKRCMCYPDRFCHPITHFPNAPTKTREN